LQGKEEMNGLDLFSGIGGIGLALKKFGVNTVAYCERERYAQGVLLSRMQSGEIDRAPIWDDVTTLKASMLPKIDIIFGGFPCQDISVAGHGKGLDGERSGLFYEIVRLAKEINPTFLFLENVPAIRTRGLSRICYELASLGYDLRWTIVSAGEVGACHLRERWFILGYANSKHSKLQKPEITNTNSDHLWKKQERIKKFKDKTFSTWDGNSRNFDRTSEGFSEPRVARAGDGIPIRMDRNKCCGNSVVPLQVEKSFKLLAGISLTLPQHSNNESER
jgi:DNA (cytosine-5)-methyltransferase 1